MFKPHKRRLAAIMAHVLAARIITTASPSAADAARESLGDGWVRAAGYLESAVAAQDALPFMEPEHFYLPTRLCLGEALLRAGAHGRARAVFEEDLGAWHPGNPWAMGGVRRARGGGGGRRRDRVLRGVPVRGEKAAKAAMPRRDENRNVYLLKGTNRSLLKGHS